MQNDDESLALKLTEYSEICAKHGYPSEESRKYMQDNNGDKTLITAIKNLNWMVKLGRKAKADGPDKDQKGI